MFFCSEGCLRVTPGDGWLTGGHEETPPTRPSSLTRSADRKGRKGLGHPWGPWASKLTPRATGMQTISCVGQETLL